MVKKQASGSELQLLKTHIREKNPERLYIFFGEETFLLEHYLGSLKKLVLDALTESFNYHRFNTETFNLTAFSEAVENLPMMAERTLVQVEDIDLFKMNEADRDRIAAVLSDIPEYCVVVFVYTACPWKPDKRMKKLWESIDKNGLVVEFAKQDQRDLIAWLTRHFSAHQKRISTELCAYLIDITDGTMTSLLGEIEKICAYSAADTICKADIDAVTEPVLDAVVFQMTDLLSAGRYDEALLKLQQLLKMQQEPLAILGAVGSPFPPPGHGADAVGQSEDLRRPAKALRSARIIPPERPWRLPAVFRRRSAKKRIRWCWRRIIKSKPPMTTLSAFWSSCF